MSPRGVVITLLFLVGARASPAERLIESPSLVLALDANLQQAVRLTHRPTSTPWLAEPTALYRVEGDVPVEAALSAKALENGEILLRLSLKNDSSKPAQIRVSFPRLAGLAASGDADRTAYCFPSSGAVINSEPGEFRARYGGLFPLQFVSVFDAERCGVYLMTRDRDNRDKTYWLRKKTSGGVELGVDYDARSLQPGSTWELPAAVLGGHRGDWHGALHAYRRWLQTWYRPHRPRKLWFREVFNFRQVFLHANLGLSYGAFDATTKRLQLAEMVNLDIAAFGGVDFVHVFDWSLTPQGRVGAYSPWDYLGGKEPLREEIETIQHAAIPVGVYLEGYLVSKPTDVARTHGEAWELRRADGKPHDRFGAAYRYLCPHVKPWRDYLARACSDVSSTLDVRGVYLDEIGFGYQYPCHRRDHGHAVPSSQIQGEHALIAASRSAVPPQAVLYTEETPTDVTTQLLDGSFTYAISRARHQGHPSRINLTRFALPDFKTFEILHVDRPLGSDLEGVRHVFFNGEGIWLAGASHSDTWFPVASRRLIAKTRRLLRRYRNAFTSSKPEPLVPTTSKRLFANRFASRSEVVWTLFNSAKSAHDGPVLSVEHFEGAAYWDAWNDRPAMVDVNKDEAVISLGLGPREVGCVVRADERAASRLRQLGGFVFKRSGRVVEVVLNGTSVADSDLELVASLPGLTDLSLEGTAIGDRGLAHVDGLRHLEWLNLYRTRVGDDGLARLKTLPQLKHLPIGETRVTDRGLAHLDGLHRLRYLGLRGNAVTDKGIRHMRGLEGLRGLHLGETRVSDAALQDIASLQGLEKLWLHDTAISDSGVPLLSGMGGLKELFVFGTRLTQVGFNAYEERFRGAGSWIASSSRPLWHERVDEMWTPHIPPP